MNAKVLLVLLASSGLLAGEGTQISGEYRYMEFPGALPGKILKVRKVIDSATGRLGLVSNLPEVSSVSDLRNLEELEERFRRSETGNLESRLAERLHQMGDQGRIRLAVKVKSPEAAYLDKTRHAMAELIANSRAVLARQPVAHPLTIAARHGLSVLEMRGADIMVLNAGKRELMSLKEDPDVASVWEETDQELMSVSLGTLASSGYNPGGVPSGAGSGIKAATFEHGLTASFLSCIGVTPAAYDVHNYSPPLEAPKRHTQATFYTLALSSPSASLYHRKSLTYNSSDDVDYIVNNGIQIVSMSITRGGTSPLRATYSEFLTMDNMTYSYPYPVFVTGTGNAGYAYEVNWQCYNCLNVGNVRHTNDSYYELADCTQTKNPPPRYGSCISGSGSDCAGDREMPHIVAPGIPSSGSSFATTCLEGTGTPVCGTSLSAPVVNGMAANVMAADSRMAYWPEKVRAALILTAQNVESGDWTTSTDERDGVGTVSGADAVAFATGHTAVAPGNASCVSGLAANSFYASDFGSNKRFYFQVPNPKPSGKHLRVVLTWDSNPNVSNGTNDLSDLDLVVQRNGGTRTSASWDSNVEVVDVAAADLTAGSSYYIDISPYANRMPSGAFFYYAIGWTWVKDHAP